MINIKEAIVWSNRWLDQVNPPNPHAKTLMRVNGWGDSSGNEERLDPLLVKGSRPDKLVSPLEQDRGTMLRSSQVRNAV